MAGLLLPCPYKSFSMQLLEGSLYNLPHITSLLCLKPSTALLLAQGKSLSPVRPSMPGPSHLQVLSPTPPTPLLQPHRPPLSFFNL